MTLPLSSPAGSALASGGDRLDFEIRPNPQPVSAAERAALLADPGFGRVFTDHMVTIRYAEGKGWYDARVEPCGPIPLDPATAVLHYAQEIFEGLKAYHAADGGVVLFRPEANAARFAASADRMAMARAAGASCSSTRCSELIKIDREWIPTDRGGQPLPAPVHVRQRGVPRRPARPRVPLPGHRLPGRRLLRRRGQAGDHLGLAGVHPGGARRHRRGEVRGQLRGQPRRPGRGDRARLRPGGLPRRGAAGSTSTNSAG